MTVNEVLAALQALGTDHHRNQLSRFGISAQNAYGVTSPDIQQLAKTIGKDHPLALTLFENPVHEAKLIATFLADPKALTEEQMSHWARQVYSWDLCDNLCMHLFRRSPLAKVLAFQWIVDRQEFVRRCGLVVMTSLSIHDKKATDEELIAFTDAALPYCTDERNFVKKAVSWLLRTQGKRSLGLRATILEKCDEIKAQFPESKSAQWIISDVTRELLKPEIVKRLEKKRKKK